MDENTRRTQNPAWCYSFISVIAEHMNDPYVVMTADQRAPEILSILLESELARDLFGMVVGESFRDVILEADARTAGWELEGE